MGNFNFEIARVEDIEEIARVHRESWVDAYTGIYPQTRFDAEGHEFFVEYWRPCFEDDNPIRMNLLAKDANNRIVAVSSLAPPEQHRSNTAELDRLYVLPDFRGLKLGLVLMEALRKHADFLNVPLLGSWVVEQNDDARRFYERHGFIHDRDDPDEITEFDGDRTGIFMLHYVRSASKPFEVDSAFDLA